MALVAALGLGGLGPRGALDSDSLSRAQESLLYAATLFDDEACCSQAPVFPFSGDSGAVVEQTRLIFAVHACARLTGRVGTGSRG